MKKRIFIAIASIFIPPYVIAHSADLDAVIVYGHETELIGEALTASEGIIGRGEIASRPVLRSGEILEFVPGMVVTQHSGSGKANQFFLRGFNLDHGTDFRTTIDGMPINMRTHGHGQGYTDLNFIIPEFIERIEFQKGPYHSEYGDFSTAGSADFFISNNLEQSFLLSEIGEDNYFRNVAGNSYKINDATLLLGFESHLYDGPWEDIEEDVEKFNGLIRLTNTVAGGDLSLTLMAYDNNWNSADQIPQRAIDNNLISELGSLDTTVGGESQRYSISSQWQKSAWTFNAYVIQSELYLFSNFTYFLDDPVNGDQFEQVDERSIYGANINHYAITHIADRDISYYYGLQLRYDDIDNVALHRTRARQRLSTVRQDSVNEYSIGLFLETEIPLTAKLTSTLGIRYDHLFVDVDSNNPANSGNDDDSMVNFKAGLRYTINDNWETYFNAGQSFHSNDARGSTISIDPGTGNPTDSVDLLVRGEGIETGLRFYDSEHFNISFALWLLELDSELLFVGDAGNTEASRASRRWGAELATYYWFTEQFSFDFELAWTESRFREDATDEGNHIDGSLPMVLSTGFTWEPIQNWSTTLRLRHFSERTLDSFNRVQSKPLTVINMGIDYMHKQWQLGLDILNLFDSEDHDIDYFYTSRLQGETISGVEENHFHPIEPRTIRFQVKYLF
ncbi:MAG: TonB-dependent receptor [Gammaproteobacteria bacterium]